MERKGIKTMNKLKDNKTIILLIAIILLQIIINVYAAAKREDYHIDEYYSYGLIHYDNAFIMYNEDFYNNWHNNEYFKDYLTINEQEKFDFSTVYTNQVKDVHPPLYYFLLRLACSFNTGEFSKWPGIILNIIISVGVTIVIYLICSKLFKNSYWALLVCLVNTMCIATVQSVIFIRMYELFTLNVLLLIYWHINNNKQKLNTKNLALLAVLVLTGFLTHYYYSIIVASIYFIHIIRFIKEKQWKEWLKYTATIAIAVLIAIIIFPYCIEHIFFGYRGEETIKNFLSIDGYLEGIQGYLKIFNDNILNGYINIVFGLITGLCIVNIVKKFIKKDKGTTTNFDIKYIAIPAIVYFAIIAIACKYQDFRYIIPIVPLVIITIIYIIQDLSLDLFNAKITLVITSIICIAFCCTNIPKYGNNIYTAKGVNDNINDIINIIQNRTFIVALRKVDVSNNKFMETYGIISKLEETYVLDAKSVDLQTLQEALKDKDISNGVIIMIRAHEAKVDVEKIMATGMFKEYEVVETFNPFYYVMEFK